MTDQAQSLPDRAANPDHDPWDDDPEPKLELIDSRLICSTLAGSRRVLWQILEPFAKLVEFLILGKNGDYRWLDSNEKQ